MDSDEEQARSVAFGVLRFWDEKALENGWHERGANHEVGEGGADWRPVGWFETTQWPPT